MIAAGERDASKISIETKCPVSVVKKLIQDIDEPIIVEGELVDDNEDLKNQLAVEGSDAQDALDIIAETNIESDEDVHLFAEMLVEVKGHWKRLEESKKPATRPLNESLRVIRDWFRPVQDHYVEAERIIKRKLAEYHNTQRKKKQEALREAQEAVEEGTAEEVETALAKMQDAQEPEVNTVQYREIWKWEIEDIDEVPRAFLTIDNRAVQMHMKKYKEDAAIPGIRFFKETVVASKS